MVTCSCSTSLLVEGCTGEVLPLLAAVGWDLKISISRSSASNSSFSWLGISESRSACAIPCIFVVGVGGSGVHFVRRPGRGPNVHRTFCLLRIGRCSASGGCRELSGGFLCACCLSLRLGQRFFSLLVGLVFGCWFSSPNLSVEIRVGVCACVGKGEIGLSTLCRSSVGVSSLGSVP